MKKFQSPFSEFTSNALTLITGTTLAQVIPVAISPILTRLYSPEDYGVFALFVSIVAILSAFASGKYELAIMLPRRERDAANILGLTFVLAMVSSAISLGVLAIFNESISQVLGNEKIAKWLYVVPGAVFLNCVFLSFSYWENRQKRYKRLALNRVVQSGFTASSNLGIGLGGYGWGLILSSLFGQSVATTILGRKIWHDDRHLFSKINFLRMLALSKRYSKFPRISLPNALLDNIRLLGINMMITRTFSVSALGQFSLAWKMVQVPMSLIGGALTQVFFQRIASAEKWDLYRIIKKYILKLVLISLPIFIGINLFALDLFIVVFGEKWHLAGEAASVMSIWLFMNFISSPITNVFIVLGRQDITLLSSIVYMLAPLLIFFTFSDMGFINVLTIISYTMSAILFIYILTAFVFARREQLSVHESN
ncbi:MAG: oligosaccharide flippase family protein [Candidatus Marinimicrobia bacterium]|mgnify:CR=1 FL=1|jgi:O-antigen/teichoic acid export membrane protein|nr:oligosaccharide flippase family protein [Candidatus Neomarinimicrobiota bacterium]MBT4362144.1 oligosaccharide flippase family protein [Candidatus Neomarinimicrobiota bacterium]MBT4713667.1 oligosaccharide flippase family protein [Candidatus Neomarinimicrobiota bacterium]MBT4945199.1 oligosaccharide flippase family protein [Candidatus Neomarinimicrobiota bacterium]MBT5268809.1 oligosaccharide flippase family protein [Candidatus Neomarinimicrobiota bacterium]